MTSSTPKVVLSGRASDDVEPCPETHVEVHDHGITLTNPSGFAKFIATRQIPLPGSKTVAVMPLDDLVSSQLVEKPHSAGGAVNSTVETVHLARSRGEPGVRVSLLVENRESESLTTLGARNGFGVSFGNLSPIPVNLVFTDGGNRTIVKTPLSPPEPCETLGHFTHVAPLLREASVVALVSPSNPTMVAALMALSNGALKIAQPTGALDLASTVLMLQEVDDLVVSYDELLKLGTMTGFSLEDPGTETSPQAVETVSRILRFLRDLRLAGSMTSVITLGKRGCIVADWETSRIVCIAVELFEEVATRAGAGDTFLGAWVFYRAIGRDPVDAAVEATEAVVEWHGLEADQYRIRLHSA